MSEHAKGIDVLSPAKRALFERLLADRARARRGAATPAGGISPRPAGLATLPLSFAQQRLWFLDRLDGGNPAYHVPIPVRLRGALDVGALHASLLAVIGRHEVLRTTFDEAAGQPFQVIHARASLPWAEADLRGLGEAGEEESRLAVSVAARRPFDLRAGPLLRGLLLRLDEREHVLLLTIHHVVFDGWSISLLIRELDALYRAALAGEAAHLPPLPIQYADFALWQRQWEAAGGLDAQLGYWRRQLAGVDELLPLPTDRPRPAVQTHAGATRSGRLEPELAHRLRRLARAQGTTLFVVLLAAFQGLLHRLTGSPAIAVGTPIANRNQVETDGVIGFFVNTLVMRAEVSGDLRFRELVARVREVALGAYAHQDLPFEKLVEALQPRRDLSRPPLFQVLLAFRNTPKAGFALPGLDVEMLPLDAGVTQFDLTLSMSEDGETIPIDLVYNLDLFDPPTASRLLGYFRNLLAALGGSGERRVGELPLLTAAEAHQSLREWNDTGTGYGAGGTPLHELVAAQAARSPDRTALVFGGACLTYGELDARANRLAHHLVHLGVKTESRVGLAVERSFDMVIGILGILKAGGAYVPFDPHGPAERLARMVDDARIEALLTEDGAIGRLPRTAVPVVCLDTGWAEVAQYPIFAPAIAVAADQLAYVIFTSGSSGRPKGAMNTHRGVCNRLLWMQATYALTAADRVLQKTPASFDVSVWELFWPLLTGACLVVARPQGHQDPAYLARTMAAAGITTVHFVPSMLQAFLAEDLPAGACLRRLICSGESLSPELARRASARFGETVELHNLYGPTEAAVDVTAWACPAAADLHSVPIGRPIANLRVHVVDGGRRPVPIGVCGELLIGGVGLARGYLRRPDLTAERFVPDPFGAAGERLYRTGDLARLLPSGVIEILGRIDQQVKIRGVRIELGEIEAALERAPAVRAAAVLARPDRTGESTLMAWVAVDGPPPGVAELRDFLRRQLPEVMVPALFTFVEALPLNANGKLDRKALARTEAAAASAEAPCEAPRTPTEEILTELWLEVLGRDRIGVCESFFDLGGHSLRATQVMSRVREVLGVDLPVRALFEAPTVALLAARIERARGSVPPAPPIVAVPRQGELPLSFAQQRLWFLDRLEPESPAYHVPAAARLDGPLAPGVLTSALGQLARRHEALRTTFPESDGVPFQRIAGDFHPFLPVIDLEGLPAAARETEALRVATAEARRPFDLAAGPLVRSRLLRLGRREHILSATLHHIVSDGWSIELLLGELARLYGAIARGEPALLPELPVQPADHAVWQRAWLTGDVLAAQLAYWRGQLAGAHWELNLPRDRPRTAARQPRGASLPLHLRHGLAAALAGLSRREGTTLFMTLLAALQVTLGRLAGQDDVLVGTPIAGRNRRELEGLIGFFVNTLVLRADLRGEPPFRAFLARIRQAALDAYAHQDLPFERLVEELAQERDAGRSLLLQVMLALQNPPRARSGDTSGPAITPLVLKMGAAKFELSLTIEERADGLAGSLDYDAGLYDAATAQRLLGHFGVLLAGCVRDPGVRLSELPLLAPEERHQLLVEWGDTAAVDPREGLCVHHLVLAQARRTPAAEAVISGRDRLTYRELERRSAALAARLAAAGVRPGSFVPVLLDGGAELVVAWLGVLRAGAAFVPLDLAWPAARRDAVLEELGGGALLAEGAPADLDLARWRVLAPAGTLAAAVAADAPSPPEAPVYAIYTSGSTGRPKGVVVPHRGIVNRFLWMDRYFGAAAAARVLQTTRPVYDSAVWQLLWPLTRGGATVTTRAAESSDPEALSALIAGHGVTMTDFVPAVFQLLVQQLQDKPAEAARLASLRAVVVGGEEMVPAAAESFLRILPDVALVNLYGPTEASIGCICHRVAAGDGVHGRVPIGRPISNARPLILDRWGNPAPVGAAGELCLAGRCLAQGYLRDGGQTAGAFAPNPVPEIAHDRLYRTGDLARWMPDGRIDLLGRVDRQVKIRGLRIELGEIESALRAHPRVSAAAALAWQPGTDRGDRLLAACFTVRPGEPPPAEAELLDFLRRRLPPSMLPWLLLRLRTLPLTPAGKVDRRQLAREVARHWRPVAPGSGTAPRTPVESVLAGIWADLLGRERIELEDDFFTLGGHSLLATRVASRVRRAFGVELPIRALFEAPTLAGLARRIEEALRCGEADQVPPLLPVPRDRDLPLSFAQQRLLFLYMLAPRDASYGVPFGLRLSGPLEPSRLRRALRRLVDRHEALRTTFAFADGGPVQRVGPAGAQEMPLLDLAGLPRELAEREVWRVAAAEALRPFDLLRGPILRAALLRLRPDEHVLVAAVHHVAMDGWAGGVFRRELAALYEQATATELPELPVQYADFAAWQRGWLQGDLLDRQLEYWRQRLAGLAPSELAVDHPRPPVRSGRGAALPIHVEAGVVENLRGLGRQEDATLFMSLLAAFAVLVRQRSARDRVVLGTDIANRTRAELEGLIGLFVNQLVLSFDLSGNPTFRELLRQVRRHTLEAYAHQDAPFDRLVELLRPERDMSRTPLFQLKLVLQNVPAEVQSPRALTVTALELPRPTAKFDLLLNLLETGDGLAGHAEYSTDLFKATTIGRLLDDFARVLRQVAERPDTHLREIEAELIFLDVREEERRAQERRSLSLARARRRTLVAAGAVEDQGQ